MQKDKASRVAPVTTGEVPAGPDSDIHLGSDGGMTVDPPQSHADEQKMADTLNESGRWEVEPESSRGMAAASTGMVRGYEQVLALRKDPNANPKDLMAARLEMLENHAQATTLVTVAAGATETEQVAAGSGAAYGGLPEAAESTANTVDKFKIETHNAHADSKFLRQGGGTIKGLLLLNQTFTMGITRIGQTTVPLAGKLASSIAAVCQAAEPELPRNLDLQRSLAVALTYDGAKAARGSQTKAKNQALKQKTAQETEQKLRAANGDQGQVGTPAGTGGAPAGTNFKK